MCNFLNTVFLTLHPVFILILIYCRYKSSVDETDVSRGTVLLIITIIILLIFLSGNFSYHKVLLVIDECFMEHQCFMCCDVCKVDLLVQWDRQK